MWGPGTSPSTQSSDALSGRGAGRGSDRPHSGCKPGQPQNVSQWTQECTRVLPMVTTGGSVKAETTGLPRSPWFSGARGARMGLGPGPVHRLKGLGPLHLLPLHHQQTSQFRGSPHKA